MTTARASSTRFMTESAEREASCQGGRKPGGDSGRSAAHARLRRIALVGSWQRVSRYFGRLSRPQFSGGAQEPRRAVQPQAADYAAPKRISRDVAGTGAMRDLVHGHLPIHDGNDSMKGKFTFEADYKPGQTVLITALERRGVVSL